MIYHIYWGTSGNSGLYLHEIYQTLEAKGFKQRAFVNYYFPFDYGNKIFFKRGDIAYGTSKGKVRKIFQLYEVLKGYLIILFCSIKDRPKVINYSHAGKSYFFVPMYLKLLKVISRSNLMITCHDVTPHNSDKYELKYRKKIFLLADNLLVHNDNSVKELVEMFGADRDKIIKHLFPIMDLSLLNYKDETNPFTPSDFLFIGHVRVDKGIEFLLNSWPSLHRLCPDAKLRICGVKQPNIQIDQETLEKCNVEFNLHFISNEDYFNYILSARYVILPYIQGTNSGIISTALSLGADVITSDIPMFAENPLVANNDMFKTENKEALVEKLYEKYHQQTNRSRDKLNAYRESFTKGVLEVYNLYL